ncbi:hypothetical protein C8034_v007008 [Colletotrichum sidae]|uniref:RING-type domain-containing protein n=1 Tax=Colletotrichum sidae TaxID=1347389 RepID=A0A4R8TTZ8_9PEZI|nr:hypothetical protein C8034_v007008 [Colletotrichum sidae]
MDPSRMSPSDIERLRGLSIGGAVPDGRHNPRNSDGTPQPVRLNGSGFDGGPFAQVASNLSAEWAKDGGYFITEDGQELYPVAMDGIDVPTFQYAGGSAYPPPNPHGASYAGGSRASYASSYAPSYAPSSGYAETIIDDTVSIAGSSYRLTSSAPTSAPGSYARTHASGSYAPTSISRPPSRSRSRSSSRPPSRAPSRAASPAPSNASSRRSSGTERWLDSVEPSSVPLPPASDVSGASWRAGPSTVGPDDSISVFHAPRRPSIGPPSPRGREAPSTASHRSGSRPPSSHHSSSHRSSSATVVPSSRHSTAPSTSAYSTAGSAYSTAGSSYSNPGGSVDPRNSRFPPPASHFAGSPAPGSPRSSYGAGPPPPHPPPPADVVPAESVVSSATVNEAPAGTCFWPEIKPTLTEETIKDYTMVCAVCSSSMRAEGTGTRRRAKILHCGHVLCSVCIVRIVENRDGPWENPNGGGGGGGGGRQCPLCKVPLGLLPGCDAYCTHPGRVGVSFPATVAALAQTPLTMPEGASLPLCCNQCRVRRVEEAAAPLVRALLNEDRAWTHWEPSAHPEGSASVAPRADEHVVVPELARLLKEVRSAIYDPDVMQKYCFLYPDGVERGQYKKALQLEARMVDRSRNSD